MAQKMGPGPVFYIFHVATWQSLKKRKRDEQREAIKYSV